MSGGGFGVACASGRATGLSAGGNHLANIDGVSRMLEISRNYFAPGAADLIYQEVARFTQSRQTDKTVDLLAKRAQASQHRLYPSCACRMLGFLAGRGRRA